MRILNNRFLLCLLCGLYPSIFYISENIQERNNYISNILSKLKLDYELDPSPKINSIFELVPKAYERFEKHRKMINYSTDTIIFIKLDAESLLLINCNGDGYKIIKNDEFQNFQIACQLGDGDLVIYSRIYNLKVLKNLKIHSIVCHFLYLISPFEIDRLD